VREQRRVQLVPQSVVLGIGVLMALLAGCAGNNSPQGRADVDPYGRRSLYERPYQQRQYGPWDMPGAAAQPGPPTWYGCPQQATNCY
jgi:hypothetical protein